MQLGDFSVSLAVSDLQESRAFYEKLGFEALPRSGEGEFWDTYEKTWVILRNGDIKIGLFHGMFEKNVLTWNPSDVRQVQRTLKERGVKFVQEADETTQGPASAFLLDPDGNPILLDQHNP